MASLKTAKARLGDNVHIGPFCWLCWVDVGNDVMFGGHIQVLSGGRQHGSDSLSIPMIRQDGDMTCVSIGDDVWVGNGAIVMADIAAGSVVGAGGVVTKTFGPHSILAGIPARPVGKRGESDGALP